MSLPQIQTPATSRAPARREFLGKSEGAAFELLAWPDGTLSIGAETALGRLRFRLVLDTGLTARLMLEMPPRGRDATALATIARGLDALLRADGPALARLVIAATRRERAGLVESASRRRLALELLARDLASWISMPAEARQELPAFLARCGSGLAQAPTAIAVSAAAAAAEAAAAAMAEGAARPRTAPSDPCLLALAAAVERARAAGVRSTRHVAVGLPPGEAPRIDGIPACVGYEVLEAEIAGKRVAAEDLLVVTCGAPGSENLARLLKALSRANAAPWLVVYDAEELLVGSAPALCRIVGIPVAA